MDINDVRQRATEAEYAQFSPQYMLGETLSYLGSSAFYKNSEGKLFEIKPLTLGGYALLHRYNNSIFDELTVEDAFEFLFHCYLGKDIMQLRNDFNEERYLDELITFTREIEIHPDTAIFNAKMIFAYSIAGFSLIPRGKNDDVIRIKHHEWDAEYLTSIITAITGHMNLTPMQILWDTPLAMVCFFYAQALKMKGVENIGRVGDIKAHNEIMKEVFDNG